MDPDVMITVAFCLEVLLVALAAGVFIAREGSKARAEAAGENGRERFTQAIVASMQWARFNSSEPAPAAADERARQTTSATTQQTHAKE